MIELLKIYKRKRTIANAIHLMAYSAHYIKRNIKTLSHKEDKNPNAYDVKIFIDKCNNFKNATIKGFEKELSKDDSCATQSQLDQLSAITINCLYDCDIFANFLVNFTNQYNIQYKYAILFISLFPPTSIYAPLISINILEFILLTFIGWLLLHFGFFSFLFPYLQSYINN